MSDVVLIYPKTGLDVKKVSIGLPLPLLAVASEITGDFSVKIIDQRVHDDWREQLRAELRTGPLCVGVTAMTGHQIHHGLEACRMVREHSAGIPIVWGGMHVTLTAEQSIEHPLVDIVVLGDGEWTFRDLVRALAAKKDIGGIGSLYFKRDGRVHSTPLAPPVDLNETLPYPFELVDVENYVFYGEFLFPGVKRTLPFMGSRGCPFQCTFCSEPALTKVFKSYRMMKPELVAERTADMARRFNLDMIAFFDEEFFVYAKWATRIGDLIGGRFKWWVQTRANDLLRVDLPGLHRNGLHVVAPGLESGSPRILDFIKKKETVAEYREANRRLAGSGILAQYNMMMGFPGETLQELYETVDFTMELLRTNPRCYINSLSLFTPLPGTELSEQSRQWGYQPPGDLEAWATTSRHNLQTPWLADNLSTYLNLSYTSKFVGPRAKMLAQGYRFLPGFAFDLYSKLLQHRWRGRKFGTTWDVKLLRHLHERVVNPVLTQTASL